LIIVATWRWKSANSGSPKFPHENQDMLRQSFEMLISQNYLIDQIWYQTRSEGSGQSGCEPLSLLPMRSPSFGAWSLLTPILQKLTDYSLIDGDNLDNLDADSNIVHSSLSITSPLHTL
jgi:hypothetical protein